MQIFGKRGCNYNRDWEVEIFLSNGTTTVGSQLGFDVAKKLYDKIVKQMDDPKVNVIDIKYQYSSSRDRYEAFLKRNIVSVELRR